MAGKDTTGVLVTTNYGTSPETTMSYGVYKIESLEKDKQMVFVQNENWYGFEKQKDGSLISYTNFEVDGEKRQQYQATKIVIDVMKDEAAKLAFMKGELTEWTPSADDLLTYSTSDQLYKVDETYTQSFFFKLKRLRLWIPPRATPTLLFFPAQISVRLCRSVSTELSTSPLPPATSPHMR